MIVVTTVNVKSAQRIVKANLIKWTTQNQLMLDDSAIVVKVKQVINVKTSERHDSKVGSDDKGFSFVSVYVNINNNNVPQLSE